MRYVPPKFTKLSEMAMIDVSRLTEDQARTILEGIRWPEGISCPHCGSYDVTRLLSTSEKTRDGVIQCNDCRGQFTVSVGTVMQGSHITLRQWVQAFYSICSHKKGVSASQLQRNLGLGSYRSAWHLAHRIRLAMKQDPLASKLKGVVEVDETYIGGKPRKGGNGNGTPNKRGRGTKKAPVLVLVERKGKSVSRPIANVKASTNTAESYFAILERGVHGTFHHISNKHLPRYCDEFSFGWSNRKVTDGERTTAAIKGVEGKRLAYKETKRVA